jgi:hypothetical protein
MQSLGIAWRRATVSEIERNQRSVSVTEALGLALALGTTIEQLVDTRGPEGRRGPLLLLTDQQPVLTDEQRPGQILVSVSVSDDGEKEIGAIATFDPTDVTALVCSHTAYVETEWDDDAAKSLVIKRVQEPAS